MATKYLLPCNCGERLAVDATQAGLEFKCRCGTALVVPTLRGLAQLERAPNAAAAPTATWSLTHGVVFLAGFLAVASAVGAWYSWRQTRHFEMVVREDVVRELVGQMSPGNLMHDWHEFQAGINKSPDPQVEAIRARQTSWHNTAQFFTIAAAALAVLTAAGMVWIYAIRR